MKFMARIKCGLRAFVETLMRPSDWLRNIHRLYNFFMTVHPTRVTVGREGSAAYRWLCRSGRMELKWDRVSVISVLVSNYSSSYQKVAMNRNNGPVLRPDHS